MADLSWTRALGLTAETNRLTLGISSAEPDAGYHTSRWVVRLSRELRRRWLPGMAVAVAR